MVLRLWDSSFRFCTPHAYIFLKFHCGGLSGISAMSRALERMWGETEIVMLESAARLEVDHPPLPLVLPVLVPSLPPFSASLGWATGPRLFLSACLLFILKHLWTSVSVCVKACFHIIQRRKWWGSYLWRLRPSLVTREYLRTDCLSLSSTQKSDSETEHVVYPALCEFNYTPVFLWNDYLSSPSLPFPFTFFLI